MRKLAIFCIVAVVVVLAFAGASGLSQAVAGPDDIAVSLVGTAARAVIQYDITVSNKGTTGIGDVYVAGLIPQGGVFDAVVTTPKGATSLGMQGNVVAWLLTSIPANGSVTMSYKVNAPDPAGAANAYVAWKSPSPGTATSGWVSREAAVEAGSPKRGCTACHVGNYDLANEAQARGGPNHPKLSSDANVNTCLACHRAAADRTGLAPIMLRTIVHAAHMNSDAFIEH
ncbi:MAG: hypothetical protein Q7O66_09255, partial [Dehalococcoidia bacterium]|nr:hypothetical protein [Dehalococcoidia bacterium]